MPPLWAIIVFVALVAANFGVGYYGSRLRRTGSLRKRSR